MRVTISKRFDFDAAHFLPNVHDGHKCRRLHGHTYVVEVICSGIPDPTTQWLCDYADIAAAWEPVWKEIDHRCLNDIPGLGNPTTEVLAPWILGKLIADSRVPVSAVRVYESSSTWCQAERADVYPGCMEVE